VRFEFVTGQNPPLSLFFQIFHPHNALSMVKSEHHTDEECGQIVVFDSSKTLLGGPYTRNFEKFYDIMF